MLSWFVLHFPTITVKRIFSATLYLGSEILMFASLTILVIGKDKMLRAKDVTTLMTSWKHLKEQMFDADSFMDILQQEWFNFIDDVRIGRINLASMQLSKTQPCDENNRKIPSHPKKVGKDNKKNIARPEKMANLSTEKKISQQVKSKPIFTLYETMRHIKQCVGKQDKIFLALSQFLSESSSTGGEMTVNSSTVCDNAEEPSAPKINVVSFEKLIKMAAPQLLENELSTDELFSVFDE